MKDFKLSIKLIEETFDFFKKDKKTFRLFLYSIIAIFLISLSFLLLTFFSYLNFSEKLMKIFLSLFIIYFFLSSFSLFIFHSAIIFHVYSYLSGKKESTLKCLIRSMGKIFSWFLICSTLGLLVKLLPRKKFVRIEDNFLSNSWSLVSLFVIPIIMVENKKPLKAFRKASFLIKVNWGEVLRKKVSIKWIFLILGVLVIGIFLMIYPFLNMLILKLFWFIFLFEYLLMIEAIYLGVKGVFIATLYSYVNQGEIRIYSKELIKEAFVRAKFFET